MAGQAKRRSGRSAEPLKLTASEARRFALRANGLVHAHAGVAAALGHHGFLQLDPINVCGRMQEHILRTRVEGYGLGDLHVHAHGLAEGSEASAAAAEARSAFEHFHPKRTVLAVFEAEAWPFLRRSMASRAAREGRWMGKLTAGQGRVARRVLGEIRARGALASSEIEGGERAHNGWNTSREVKVVMDKLFGHGRLLIARRGAGGRRVYDLPENLLPAEVLARRLPSPGAVERWSVELKLRQHRLTTLTRKELPLVADRVQLIEVAGCPPLYCLRSDLALLDESFEVVESERLLAPLDPLIVDRSVTQALWGFDYVWEVYTPAARRTRGYYALPILAGERFVGHVDLRADWAAGRLRVVARRCARGYRSAAGVGELARFLGLS